MGLDFLLWLSPIHQFGLVNQKICRALRMRDLFRLSSCKPPTEVKVYVGSNPIYTTPRITTNHNCKKFSRDQLYSDSNTNIIERLLTFRPLTIVSGHKILMILIKLAAISRLWDLHPYKPANGYQHSQILLALYSSVRTLMHMGISAAKTLTLY